MSFNTHTTFKCSPTTPNMTFTIGLYISGGNKNKTMSLLITEVQKNYKWEIQMQAFNYFNPSVFCAFENFYNIWDIITSLRISTYM